VECSTNSFADLETLRNSGVGSMEMGSILRYVELHQKTFHMKDCFEL
jgi:hypothetical protein